MGVESFRYDWGTFRSVHSIKVLDVPQASQENGVGLIQWSDISGHDNQQFRIERIARPGSVYSLVRIVARHSNKVLDVEGASHADGARIIQWDWHGGDNQLFFMTPKNDGTYAFTSLASRKVIDVKDWARNDGAMIQQWQDFGNPNQRWFFL
jgi:hypothetical protein